MRTKQVLPVNILLALIAYLVLPSGLKVASLSTAGSAAPEVPQTEQYNLAFSTYFGGSGVDSVRDIFVDSQGYVYITGGTASNDFPTTTGPVFNNGVCSSLGSNGRMDVYVAKFNPQGDLLWSRLLGGPCYDRAYAIEVDAQGAVLVAGRSGEGFPVTPGALQTTFQGNDAGVYGLQNSFVAKLAPDGSNIVWATYVGVGQMARDMVLDGQGNIYIPLTYSGVGGLPPASWFTNAYQKTPHGGVETGVIKIKSDGSQALWATWLGGTQDDHEESSIRLGLDGSIYLAAFTNSSDIPTTAGAFDRSYNGGKNDFYVARLSSDGSSLIFGTYLGGSLNELINTHNLAVDDQGDAYVTIWTNSRDFPTTPGAFQLRYNGGTSDMAVVKLSGSGAMLKSTYLGGSDEDNPDGVYIDAAQNVYLVGQSMSNDFPVTANAYQNNLKGAGDAVLVRLGSNFSQLNYATFFGGSSNDNGRTAFFGPNGRLYLAGTSNGAGWPVKNAVQSTFAGGPGDGVVVRFDPANTIPPTLDKHEFMPLLLKQKLVGSLGPVSTNLTAANQVCFHTGSQP